MDRLARGSRTCIKEVNIAVFAAESSVPLVITHVAYLTVMHNLMSVWIVQVGGGAPSWPSALHVGAADRVGGDHPDRVRAGDSTRRCARLQRCIRRRVRVNPIVIVYSSIGIGY